MIDPKRIQLEDYLVCGEGVPVVVKTIISGPDDKYRIDTICPIVAELGNIFLSDKEDAEEYRVMSFNDLHYMPLTAELMRKYFPTTDILTWYECWNGIHIELDQTNAGSDVVVIQKVIYYVHELQHILKDNGIDIKIEIE